MACELVRSVNVSETGLHGISGIVRANGKSPTKACAASTASGMCVEAACSKQGAGSFDVTFDSRSYLLTDPEAHRHCEGALFGSSAYGCVDYGAGSSVVAGATLSFTVDLSRASCGCNAALYLVAMPTSTDMSTCGDRYCDANKVCGVRCAEIDLMEANLNAFVSTVHVAADNYGEGWGQGHYILDQGRRFRSQDECPYGPSDDCTIDSRQPFEARFSFAAPGAAFGFDVALEQHGRVAQYGPVRYTGGDSAFCGGSEAESCNRVLQQRVEGGMCLCLLPKV